MYLLPDLPRRGPAAFGLAATLFLAAACASSGPTTEYASQAESGDAVDSISRDAEPIGTDLALATFDSAWSRINASYYDPDFRGIDWAGIRDELRPAVAVVETRGELRDILRDMLSRLGESHFAILPQERVDGITVDEAVRNSLAGDLQEVSLN